MGSETVDVLFVGGGLANGLIAYRLSQVQPEATFTVLERGDTLGGRHTWSFHDSDLSSRSLVWITPLITRRWDSYEVKFPGHTRVLSSGYNSIASSQFHDVIARRLGDRLRLGTDVAEVRPDGVVTERGETIRARLVVDGRGWIEADAGALGYQKFLGQLVRLKTPHGLHRATLMDATCEQRDGFRFFYLLPWSENELLIEDTRYSDGPAVEAEEFRSEIAAYCARAGWDIAEIAYEEIGSLPIPLTGDSPPWNEGIVRCGVGAGLFHATTGYSFRFAVRFAEAFAGSDLRDVKLRDRFLDAARAHWQREAFFRFLNRMLFRAARPDKRYRVLERFYRLPQDLIQRFYSGCLETSDVFRILIGKPPVPILGALRCLSTKRSAA